MKAVLIKIYRLFMTEVMTEVMSEVAVEVVAGLGAMIAVRS